MSVDENQKHRVAIVRFVGVGYTDYIDDGDNLIQSITEWEEVDDGTYRMLVQASQYVLRGPGLDQRFAVIEQLKSDSLPIIKGVSDYIAAVVKQKAGEEAAKRSKEAKLVEKKRIREMGVEQKRLQDAMKTEEARLKLYKELQAEFDTNKKETS